MYQNLGSRQRALDRKGQQGGSVLLMCVKGAPGQPPQRTQLGRSLTTQPGAVSFQPSCLSPPLTSASCPTPPPSLAGPALEAVAHAADWGRGQLRPAAQGGRRGCSKASEKLSQAGLAGPLSLHEIISGSKSM